jgi:predicted amidohydrolase
MSDDSTRRTFLRQTAVAVAFSTCGATSGASRLDAAETASSTDAAREDELPVFREIEPQHPERIMQRSAAEHQRLSKSLNEAGARPLTVAACQMANHCDGEQGKQSNLGRMLKSIDFAAGHGVQVIAFPELCLPGYLLDGTPEAAATINHALSDVPGQSAALEELATAAQRHGMVIAFGFCEREGDRYYNAIGLIDADGSWGGTRRKNPLSPHPFETVPFTEPDPSLRSTVFDTRYGRIGLSNCFDGEFPESIRRMRLAGAELLLWCNAGTGNPQLGHTSRINASACYAQSNRLWVVCCNAVAGNFYGTSVIVGPSGEPLVVLPPDQEALGLATINLAFTADWDRWASRLDPIWRRDAP